MNTDNDDHNYRFGGNTRLFGAIGAQALADAHICVIGIGGVGSWAAEALARANIGTITLIDLDEICVSNTNRQIHALAPHHGKSKAQVMADRVRRINPHCDCRVIDDFATKDTVANHISADFDYVFDAIDNMTSKCAIIVHCRRNKIPLICTGGAGGKINPTLVKTADLSRTTKDSLLASVRKYLRRDHNYSRNLKRRMNIRCIYSDESAQYPQPDGSTCESPTPTAPGEEGRTHLKLDCAQGFGSTAYLTGTFAFVGVAYIIEKIIAKAKKAATTKQ